MKGKKVYLYDTQVENIFIMEIMNALSAEALKVYLFIKMYESLGRRVSEIQIEKMPSMSKSLLKDALRELKSFKLVQQNDGKISSISLKEKLFCKDGGSQNYLEEEGETEHKDKDIALRNLVSVIEKTTGSTISGSTARQIMELLDEGISAELIGYCYMHCAEKGKTSLNYIKQVLFSWIENGRITVEEVESYLSDIDARRAQHKQIFNRLGFYRQPTEIERKTMDSWFDEYHLKLDDIFAFCDRTLGISNPNIKYINTIIGKNYEKRNDVGGAVKKHKVNASEVKKYYAEIREKTENDRKKRIAHVSTVIPQMSALLEEREALSKAISDIVLSGRGSRKSELAEIQKKNDTNKRAVHSLLLKNGFAEDYLEKKYRCSECEDTGTNENGERCRCYYERVKELEHLDK